MNPDPSRRSRFPFPVDLPGGEAGPLRKILGRLVYRPGVDHVGRDLAYTEPRRLLRPRGRQHQLLDAFYYSTVSITTTGYGDIRPVTEDARLLTRCFVTPARVLFLILLVGTTLEILAERSRNAYRVARWRRDLKEHTIVCGYGVKGRAPSRP